MSCIDCGMSCQGHRCRTCEQTRKLEEEHKRNKEVDDGGD